MFGFNLSLHALALGSILVWSSACKSPSSSFETSDLAGGIKSPEWKGDVTVMSYNIAGPKTPDLDVIAREIKASKAQIVGLQEVDHFTLRNFKNMAGELAKKTGMHVVFESARWTLGGKFGNAVLSRWPITSHKALQLPHVDSIPDPDGLCTSKVREQRIAVVATIKVASNVTLDFVTTHFGHCLLEQQAAVEALGKTLDTRRPVILVGDFNAKLMAKDGTTGTVAKKLNDLGFEDAQTNLSQQLPEGVKQRIDWILHSRCWVSKKFSQGELSTSDHRPVTAQLQLDQAACATN